MREVIQEIRDFPGIIEEPSGNGRFFLFLLLFFAGICSEYTQENLHKTRAIHVQDTLPYNRVDFVYRFDELVDVVMGVHHVRYVFSLMTDNPLDEDSVYSSGSQEAHA